MKDDPTDGRTENLSLTDRLSGVASWFGPAGAGSEGSADPESMGDPAGAPDGAAEPAGADARLGRRSFLAATGTAAAVVPIATHLGMGPGDSDVTQVRPVTTYGYGGMVVLGQPASATVSTAEAEPNDEQYLATTVDVGVPVSGVLDDADVDWFAFDVGAAEPVSVEFQRPNPAGLSLVLLYDPDGRFTDLGHVGGSDPVRLVGDSDRAGTYFLEVVDVQGSEGPYSFTVTTGVREATPTASPTPAVPTTAPSPTPSETPTARSPTSGTSTGQTTATGPSTATPTPTRTPTSTSSESSGQSSSGQSSSGQSSSGQSSTATPTATATRTATPTATLAPEDEYGEQHYGEFGYGGVSA